MRYRAGDGSAEARFADPGGSAPAVIVLHEVWGMTPFIEGVLADLADLGFASFAPVLYWRDRELFSAENIREAMKAVWKLPLEERFDRRKRRSWVTEAKAPTDASRLLDKLYDQGYRSLICDDVLRLALAVSRDRPSLGAVGYSMGGGFAFRLAAGFKDLRACVTYSAQPPSPTDLAESRSPLLSFYGSRDRFMTKRVPEFVAEALRLGRELTLKVYPSAAHEFFDRYDRMGYLPEFAADSWKMATQFLGERLTRASQS